MLQINVCLSSFSVKTWKHTWDFCLQLPSLLACADAVVPLDPRAPSCAFIRASLVCMQASCPLTAEPLQLFCITLCRARVFVDEWVWMMETWESFSLRKLLEVVGQERLHSADCPVLPIRLLDNIAGDDSCLPDFPCSKSEFMRATLWVRK